MTREHAECLRAHLLRRVIERHDIAHRSLVDIVHHRPWRHPRGSRPDNPARLHVSRDDGHGGRANDAVLTALERDVLHPAVTKTVIRKALEKFRASER